MTTTMSPQLPLAGAAAQGGRTLIGEYWKTVAPLKIGWFGSQGAGKSTSAALLSLALSVEVYGKAPVYILDTEPGWQFLRKLFAVEGVELIQRTDANFKFMKGSIREAEKFGCCVWGVDSLSTIWMELLQSFKEKNNGFIPINKWGDIRQVWNEYTTLFLNTPMCAFALGRLGNEWDEIEDEKSEETKLVKTGTKFKAGGGESFGYEPHLLLELSLERKSKVIRGSKREGEGRMVHRVDVLKDRTWALNGKVIRWSDKPRYEPGGYRQVWESLKPHWADTQAAGHTQIKTGSSAALIAKSGHSEYYEQKRRQTVLVEEFDNTLTILWGGQGLAEKQIRIKIAEALFGTRSKTAVEAMEVPQVERGVRIMQAFERHVKEGDGTIPTSEAAILNQLQVEIEAYDNEETVRREAGKHDQAAKLEITDDDLPEQLF